MTTGEAPPSIRIVQNAVLVAGRDGLDASSGQAVGDPVPLRQPLRRIGVRTADGTPDPLASVRYRNRFVRAHAAPFAPPDASTEDTPTLAGLSIFGGVIGPQFGHQVTQSLGRLWLADQFPTARIVFLAANLGFDRLPGYVTDLVRALGVANRLELITRTTICETLALGPDICNLERRPSVQPQFLDWRARHDPVSDRLDADLDLYVSRSGLGLANGQFLQETALEHALAAQGYQVFHPQDATIAVQAATYRRARRVIFADGSAAHLWSLFAHPKAKVAIVLRRPPDRHFAAWFRAIGPKPAMLDHGIADFTRRGEGNQRSVGLVDLRAVWDRLRDLGFHDDPAQIGPSKADLRDWLAAFSGRKTPFPRPPFALDDRSRALLGLRNRITIRPHALT
ncbi:MAG TPA: glycosyltransferase 61 family protein [Tabrizicola sp.]|nr:glycosyltransferase 61 family protein [Tabrizicola sp.]